MKNGLQLVFITKIYTNNPASEATAPPLTEEGYGNTGYSFTLATFTRYKFLVKNAISFN